MLGEVTCGQGLERGGEVSSVNEAHDSLRYREMHLEVTVLIFLSYYHKIPQSWWVKQQKSFSHSSGAWQVPGESTSQPGYW